MKKQTIQKIAAVIVPTALFLSFMAPAFAQNSTATATPATPASTKALNREKLLLTRSGTAIDKRVADLTKLESTLGAMVNVDASTKASLSASIQSTISTLSALKTKIASDADVATMQADVKSIASGTRVYMLVVPQSRILAAADRASTVADMILAMNSQLATRISAAPAGTNTSTITGAQADMLAKTSDAKTQAQAAITAVSGLTPDNGDTTKAAANTSALKTGRMDVQAAQKDLQAARADMKTIMSALKITTNTAPAATSATQ